MEIKLILNIRNYNYKNKSILFFIFLFFCFCGKYNTINNIIKGPKISIFLPIYNKEDYINRSIQSIQKQTLKEIEIIAVNDFSSDGTLDKLTSLMEKDGRIKILNNKRNRGLLYSRAKGILNSSGEYLMNLDPDDELAKEDSLEFLYKKAKKTNVDILSFFMLQNQQNQKKIIKCYTKHKIEKQPELFESIFRSQNSLKDYFITNKLIKKEIFLKAYEAFKKEINNGKWNYHEDHIWSILVNKFARSKLCTNKLIYIYNKNKDSLMENSFSLLELQNLLYKIEKFKKLFITKEEEKYLIAEYNYLLNILGLFILL